MSTVRSGREDLPAAVRDLAIRLGLRPGDRSSDVRLTQTGRMKTSLRSKGWIGFRATQTISARTCEFDWRAKAGPLGLFSGRDALLGGEGRITGSFAPDRPRNAVAPARETLGMSGSRTTDFTTGFGSPSPARWPGRSTDSA